MLRKTEKILITTGILISIISSITLGIFFYWKFDLGKYLNEKTNFFTKFSSRSNNLTKYSTGRQEASSSSESSALQESSESAYIKSLSALDICSIKKIESNSGDRSNKIAFIKMSPKSEEYGYELWLMDPDGKEEQKISIFRGGILSLNWSPDRTKIAYLSYITKYSESTKKLERTNVELCYYDFVKNDFKWIENQKQSANQFGFPYYWTSDSESLLYSRENIIWKYSINSNQNSQIAQLDDFQPSYPDASDYGPNDYNNYINLAFVMSKDKIYSKVKTQDSGTYIQALDLNDPTKNEKVIETGGVGSFGMAPDNSYLVYATNYKEENDFGGKIMLKDLATQQEKEVRRDGPCTGHTLVDFTSDSSRFIIQTQCADGLEAFIYSKDGTLINNLESSKGVPLLVELSPDSSTIFVSFFNYSDDGLYSLFDTNGNVIQEFEISNAGEEKMRGYMTWSSSSSCD